MRAKLEIIPFLVALIISGPAIAGMNEDLANCTKSDSLSSAEACTRVIESGRLRRIDHFIGYFNRGWGYRNAADDRKALADFDRAAKIRPSHAETYYSRALTHHDLGEVEKSDADLARYVELKPDHWLTYYNRALLYRKRNEPQLALADLDKARDLNPGEQRVSLLRALILSDIGDHAEARRLADAAIVATPKNGFGYYVRGVVGHRQNQSDAAVADLEKAVELQMPFPAAYSLLGQIAESKTGGAATAQRRYEQALASAPLGFDGKWAQDEARSRLQALRGGADDNIVASRAVKDGCRKYIPETGTTIVIDCE